jgi:hypothetical protein
MVDEPKDELRLENYGAAKICISLAKGKISSLIEAFINGN